MSNEITARDRSRERLYIIGNLIVSEASRRLLVAKITGNLDQFRDMMEILNDAMEQVGNSLGCAERLYARKQESEGGSHE